MVIPYGREPNQARRIRQRQGSMIRKARQLKGITITELAEACGVTPGAVSQWETGRFAPRQDKQVLIAHALDVPHSILFNLDGEAA